MGYFVHIAPDVVMYIYRVEGLTAAGQDAVIDGVIDELGRDADGWLERRPLEHESLRFRYDYLQPDSDALFNFNFVVDGTEMAVGVVTVVMVECERVTRDDL